MLRFAPMQKLVAILMGGMLPWLAQADSAAVLQVHSQRYPVKGTTLEAVLSFEQVGTFGYLRQKPTEASYEFTVKWSVQAEHPLQDVILRIEYLQTRRDLPQTKELKFSTLVSGTRWSKIRIPEADLQAGGEVAAWKISVIQKNAPLCSQHSLVWGESKPLSSAKP